MADRPGHLYERRGRRHLTEHLVRDLGISDCCVERLRTVHDAGYQSPVAKSHHSPGRPLRAYLPCSDTEMPEPTRCTFTASDTSTCPGLARSQMRFAMVTAKPTTSWGRTSTSPVWTPA